jgi:CIC family chloride channel protein
MTLGTFGIGGIVGPLGRVSAGLMSRLALLIHSGRAGRESRTAATCGMAAVVGAVFHSSIGGGIFAIEIIQRSSMDYRDLFPAIIASSGAVFLARSLGFAPFYPLPEIDAFMGPWGLPVVLAVGILGGAAGLIFNGAYALISSRIRHNPRISLRLKAIVGTTVAVSVAWLIQPELLGSSREMVRKLMFEPTALTLNSSGPLPLALICIVLLVVKSWGTSLTVGTGMSAGFVGPVVIIGMLLACAFCDLMGIPLISPLYYAALAAGFAATLASVMNVPIAAAIISLEIFGIHYGLPAALAAIIGFQINRSRTIYDLFPASAPEIGPIVD